MAKFGYIAFNREKKAVAICAADHKTETVNTIMEWLDVGYAVRRMSWDDAIRLLAETSRERKGRPATGFMSQEAKPVEVPVGWKATI